MNLHKAWLVFKKDWLEIKRNWQVLLPIIIIPIIFAVVFPVIISALSAMPADEMNSNDFQTLLSLLPIDAQELIGQMTSTQLMVYIMALYIFAPMFLIIPIMASSVLSSDSFAGERERKTIEALLATPISDSELFMGKILVSFIPVMIVTFTSFAAYTIILDLTTIGLFNGMLLLPNLTWFIMILGVAPTLALCSIGLTVLISAKVKGFKEAQQISVLLLFPVLGLMFAQIFGILILGPAILAALIAILVAVDAAIFYVGIKIFKGEEILSKM
jgi:ABC-type Na+ efflux pump permease subunit